MTQRLLPHFTLNLFFMITLAHEKRVTSQNKKLFSEVALEAPPSPSNEYTSFHQYTLK